MTIKAIGLIAIVTAALAGQAFTGKAFAQPKHTYDHARSPQYHEPQQRLEPYPSYLPWGSCQELWYTVPGYRSPSDCND
jgi:hypothetical protein